MSDTVIQVENLGKRYRIGQRERYLALRDVITEAVKAPFRALARRGKHNDNTDNFIWALKDVSFEVKHGEVLGIIGRNGAGKSTLLKVLSQITEPTEGHATIHGRVASLLEVGTGFHPELTGRENIFLNGAILGMSRKEILRKFDEIVAFSEIEKFLDTPVKRYSSGMYVRLAFAVAAHLEPEILLVDEVLAVGDAAFQKKCLGKMGEVAKEGRTVLFVSHNMTAVQNLCGRVIWIDQGQIVEDGLSGNIVSKYLSTSFSVSTERVWPDMHTAPGNDQVRVRRVCIRPESGSSADEITIKTPLVIEFEYWNLVANACLNLSLGIYNQRGVFVINTVPINEPVWNGQPFPVGLFRSMCYIPGNLLNDDSYGVTLLIVKDAAHIIYTQENALVFEVTDNTTNRVWYGKWPGAVRPDLKWSTELVEARDIIGQ